MKSDEEQWKAMIINQTSNEKLWKGMKQLLKQIKKQRKALKSNEKRNDTAMKSNEKQWKAMKMLCIMKSNEKQ